MTRGVIVENLKKYKDRMDGMYFFFLASVIIIEFIRTTDLSSDLYLLFLRCLSLADPQMSLMSAKFIFGTILNFPLLVAIPAVYVIAVEMKTAKERIIGMILLLLGWFYSLQMREWNDVFLFRTLLFIVASYGKDFKKIARISIAVITVCLLTVTILSVAGVIPDHDLERNGRVRHSFGMNGPVAYAAHICMILLTLIFLRNGILRWYDYLIITVLTVFNLVLIDGRVCFLSTILAVLGAAVYAAAKRGTWRLPEKILTLLRRILSLSFVIVAGIYFLMTLTYRYDENAFYHRIPFLSTFEGRIAVPHRLLGELGLSLFGNYMERYHEMEHAVVVSGSYDFLDSSYSRMLLIYGAVGLALTLWIFTRVQWRLMEKRQTFRMYLLTVVAIDHVVERFLMDPMYHVFMLLFFAVIPQVERGDGEDSLAENETKKNHTDERKEDGTFRRAYEGVDIREVYRKKPFAYKAIKRLADIVGSFFALILLSPVFLITAIAVKSGDGGPVFYSGKRLGKDMKYFPMHKFRSMCVGAEEMIGDVLREEDKNGLAFKIKDDPRITRVGSVIRRASIDELPQFWNVLKGQMSLVGPRPIQTTDKEINEYEKQRWAVRPGITGIWQVCGRSDVPWDEWVEMDLKYINEMSIRTDLKLLWATVGRFWKRTRRPVE